MTTQNKAKLTEGSITSHLVKLTIPMIGGIFAISAFHLVDTYFISKLGTKPLAAISFTFPVVMVIGSIAMGLGMSASILISRAIGSNDFEQAKKLTTCMLLLAVAVVTIIAALGLLFIDPLFRMLGAGDDTLPIIKSYMTLWFSCVCFLLIPMVGNNCIRATGDTLTPGTIMIGLAVMNAILDPILIFGWWGIPKMGVFGAALATVISRAIGTVISLSIITYKYNLIDWKFPGLITLLNRWKSALHVAVPSAATHLLMPVATGFIIRLVSIYGNASVAAVGAAGRIIHLLYIIPMAAGSVLIPFSGQNWGAGKFDRVKTAWQKSNRFSLYYGLVTFAIVILSGKLTASLFGEGDDFIWTFSAFLVITLATSGLQHIGVHSGFILNAIGYPTSAFLFNAARVFLLLCPLSWLGRKHFDLTGIFAGMALSQVVAGLSMCLIMPAIFNKHSIKQN
ncbi:MAG: MATE family efflux transporter [Planctomycetota bacterium]